MTAEGAHGETCRGGYVPHGRPLVGRHSTHKLLDPGLRLSEEERGAILAFHKAEWSIRRIAK
ncbi:hypothetical protein H257_08067 [Aphanomyces astaci]|uniref:Uncharacterized protein n=1 Tax=Aphanomyces astaci TaxID=112090 RepID=W4GFW4_APHAT|nr:hypothetical protein H257_08067 [Aphanomyces astaci]ETV78562.1 hypothetical protein H257_08067 [Aphanomyces astaci]|eukprot:XP_009832143.1 hypothetical protein H257_08067 [Aphanomyces astaci]